MLKRFPIISCLFILFLCAIFLLEVKAGAANNYKELLSNFAISRSALVSHHYERIITANFFHMNIMHLISNISGLLFYLSLNEIFLGKGRSLILITTCSIGGSLGTIVFGIVNDMVGASNIMLGMLASLGVLILKYRKDLGNRFLLFVLIWVVNFILVNTIGLFESFKIDYGAHAGGFVLGLITTVVLVKGKKIGNIHSELGRKGKVFLFVSIIITIVCIIKGVIIPLGNKNLA
jgi:rhomboid protease GluP